MASIRREIVIEAPPDRIWAALRDFGAVHERLDQGNAPWQDYESSHAPLAAAMKTLGFER